MSEAVDSRVENLRRYIADQEHRWFVLEHPGVSEHRLEQLRDELAALEASGAQKSLDSPTWRRGAPPRERLERVAHQPPWRPAVAVHSVAALKNHHARVSAAEPNPHYVAAGTLEGVQAVLTYEAGILTRAVLLGDGFHGYDVTDNARTVPSVPLRLRPPGSVTESRVTKLTRQALGPSTMTPVPPFPNLLAIRVVFALRSSALAVLDRGRVDAGEPPYASVRGAVLGSLARLDSRVTASRPLSAFAVGCRDIPSGIDSTWQLLGALKSWGFAILPLSWRCKGLTEVLDFVTELQRVAQSFDFPLEGGLLTLSRGAFGVAEDDQGSLPPRTVRLAFPAPGRPARVADVYFAVGRGGAVLPVATLSSGAEHDLPVPDRAPLSVAGVDTFVAEAAGDAVRVRPGAASPIMLRDDAAVGPLASERCPSCHQPLHGVADEPFRRCLNRLCPGRVRARLLHLIGPRGLNLRAIPTRSVDRIASELGETDLSSLLRLDPERLDALFPGAGAQWVEASRSREMLPLWWVIYLLGIPYVGERVARIIAHHVKQLGRLAELSTEEVWELADVSPEVAEALSAWLAEDGRHTLARLSRLPIEVAGDAHVFSAPFYRRRIVVAGTFEMGLSYAADEIERRGGTIQTRVGRTTDLLVAGMDAEQASNHAAMYNIPTIEEATLATVLVESSGRVRVAGPPI